MAGMHECPNLLQYRNHGSPCFSSIKHNWFYSGVEDPDLDVDGQIRWCTTVLHLTEGCSRPADLHVFIRVSSIVGGSQLTDLLLLWIVFVGWWDVLIAAVIRQLVGFQIISGICPQISSNLQLEIHLLSWLRRPLNSLVFPQNLGCYMYGLLNHFITSNLEDQGAYCSLASTPWTWSAWGDLPWVQDSHWHSSGGHWGTQAIIPLQGTCTRWQGIIWKKDSSKQSLMEKQCWWPASIDTKDLSKYIMRRANALMIQNHHSYRTSLNSSHLHDRPS